MVLRRVWLFLFVLSVGGGSAFAQWSSWNYSTRIQFNTTSTGANVSSNVTNFPLLIKLDSTNFYFHQAKVDGADIRFADPDGTSLSYEIERYSPALGVAEIWVKVPQIDANSTQDYITMYWGNASATAVTSGSSVWSSYQLAYHLSQSPGGSAPQFTDASGNGNHGTAQSGATGDSSTSQIGMGFKLNGSSKYISTTTSFVNPTSLTASCWFKTTTTSGGKILGFGTAQTGSSGGYDRHIYMNNNGTLTAGVWNSAENSVTTTSSYNDGKWHHAVFRFGASGVFLYIDGEAVASNASYTSVTSLTGYWKFGYDQIGIWSGTHTSDYLNGTLDECQVIHSELSASFIKLQYETQKQNSYALTYENTNLTNWAYSSKVYINTSNSGANITSDLTNYPLLVRLTNANFHFSQAQSDGGDLRFADSTGRLLNYSIERFDATNKLAEIWVMIPTVSGNNNRQYFKMHWGKSNAISLSSPSGVFQTNNSYVGVWNLNESSGSAADATTYGNSGTFTGSVPNVQTGMVARGHYFDGNGDYVSVANASSLSMTSNDRVTVSAWINRSGANVSADANEGVAGKWDWNAGATNREYLLYNYNSGSCGPAFIISTDGSATNETRYCSNFPITNGTWYHIVGVADGSKVRVYVNGDEKSNTNFSGNVFNNTGIFAIGRMSDNSGAARQYFNGFIDHVEVSNIARSADWIKMQYENQKTGSTVVRVGYRSDDYAKSLRLNFNTTSTGANVSGNVTNIPILVRLTSSNFDFSVARADGTDLLFIDKDGSRLYHQVVDFDTKNQVGNVWVKVPQVDGNSTTDFITLYYGCSSCLFNPQAKSDSVFSTYAGRFHLNDPRDKAYDATGNAYHGAFYQSQAFASGIVSSQAASFDGSGDYVQTTVPTTAGTRTLSAWIYPRTSDNVANIESVIDGDVAGQFGAGFGLDNGYFKAILDNEFWTSTYPVTLSTWQHVALRFNATKAVLFVNGTARDSVTYTQGGITSTTMRIGRSRANAFYFDGLIQEVGIMDAYASTDYIKLAYENQKSGSTLFSSTTFNTSSFQKSKIFKFNTTASGANVTGDVYNFPLLLRITGSTIVDAVESSAPDIRFLDGDGVTWLDYQIERWSQSLDSAEVWVKVPKIDGNSAADFITMYYDQASGVSIPDGQCASCVFDTTNGFAGVWHLAEAGNDNASNYQDATINGYHGTGNSMVAGSQVAALTGYGQNFDGSADYIGLGTTAGSTKAHTVSFWMKISSLASFQSVVDKLPNDATGIGWNFKARTNGDLYYRLGSESAATDLNATSVLAAGTWLYVTGTFDGVNTARVYTNGALKTSSTSITRSTSNTTTTLRLGIPSAAATAERYGGVLDELQISKVVRDSNWVKLSYQTQRRDAAPFFNPSPADFNSTRKFTFNTTVTGANVSDSVTNFPLLVRIAGTSITDAVQGSGTTAPSDIRFLDGDGKTWLNYQVERWDRSVDSAEVWVLVPQVDGNSNTDHITLYYDDVSNGSMSDGQCASCVFSTQNNWVAAWHLNGSVTDAKGSYNGTDNGTSDVGGIIANARSFNGTSSYIDMGNPQIHSNTAYTLMAWVKGAANQTDKRIFGEGSTSTTTPMIGIGTSSTGANGTLSLFYRNDANTTEINHSVTTGSPFDGNWNHIAITDSSGSVSVYLNGSLDRTISYTKGTKTLNSFSVGAIKRTSVSSYFAGSIDEVGALNTNLSANRIKLTYHNQRVTGNVFWNSRPGPNNRATLTASASNPNGGITLSWAGTLTDSSNADSVGIWVKYSSYPDSVGSAATLVRKFALADTAAYTYPAVYPTTYYFSLAIRNTSGKWSPFTKSASDTAVLAGSSYPDTIYVDSAIGNDGNSCASAQSPASPKLTITNALTCGGSATDSLVVRVMPGTYTSDNAFAVTSSKPSVVTSFDNLSRAVLAGNGSVTDYATWTYAVSLSNYMTLRAMDIRANATTSGNAGIYVRANVDSVVITGNRIYGASSYAFAYGISIPAGDCEAILVANNLIHQPSSMGIFLDSDDRTNIMHNVFYGSGGSTKGIYMDGNAWSTGFFTITNNIFYNWDYGIQTTDSDNEIGVVSNNLFHLVTTGREVSGETDANKILKDPLFVSTDLGSRHAFKLLPGSPAIDAGTSTIATGSSAWSRIAAKDFFGSTRSSGTAPDMGLYEGTGYTQTPTGDFDSLIVTSTSTTVIVKNSKWKLVFDQARGAGINFLSNMTDSATNLLASNSLLFDVTLDSYVASSQTSNTQPPRIRHQSKSRVQVHQMLAVSASLDLHVYYTIYPSGHIYVQSEIINLTTSAASIGTATFKTMVGTATAAYSSATGANGFGYLTTSSRDVFVGTTQALDSAASAAETWVMSSSSGASGYVQWTTSNLADPAGKFKRLQNFVIYLGETSLDYGKAALLHADANAPTPLSVYSGSPLHVHSWQSQLMGHWSFDEGGGSTVRDNSVYQSNNGTPTSLTYASGAIGAAGSFTTSSSISVADNSTLEASTFFTLAFWIYPVSASMGGTTPYAIWKGTGTSDGYHVQKVSGQNQWTFTMGSGSVTVSATNATWSHLAFVVSNGQIHAYVNGTLMAASTTNATATANASNLIFGDATGGDTFYGMLDDIRIYANHIMSEEVQAIYRQGFSRKDGAYRLRADNNHRVVAVLNSAGAATRFQPVFIIDNWYASATPKYVYVDGTRLKPNVDYSSDLQSLDLLGMGGRLCIQINKAVTSQNANLFIDDDDSSGYQGVSSQSPKLAMSSVSGDYIAIQNFTGSTFGTISSKQWYLELDLNGGTSWGSADATSKGYGNINVWKSAATHPGVAISTASNLTVSDGTGGTALMQMKFDDTGAKMFAGGAGHASPATYTYTLTDSSSTRLSLVMANTSLQNSDGTATLAKRWTIYPNGRIFANFTLSAASFNLDQPRVDFVAAASANDSAVWSTTTATANARAGLFRGTPAFHSFVGAVLSIKSAGATTTAAASNVASTAHTLSGSWVRTAKTLQSGLFQSADIPVTVNFVLDIGRDINDSATADSLMTDLQTPATITAITGSKILDALDFNADSSFAEGDGAYVYQSNGSGIAQFSFNATSPRFSPAFRITNWSQGTLPDYVFINNQSQVLGYDYNAHINVATSTLILQFNKTLSGGSKIIHISHKSGLAVTVQQLMASGGPGADTVSWVTQSEFENLGYHVWRRVSGRRAVANLNVSTLTGNLEAAKLNEGEIWVAQSARMAADIRGGSGLAGDTVPALQINGDQLRATGWQRLTQNLIPGAPEGNSASRRDYRYIDDAVETGVIYEYILEAVDVNLISQFFGSVSASPDEALATSLHGAFPNPFNPITTLRFTLASPQKVSLVIYNAKGQTVRTLVRPDRPLKPGHYRLYWDTKTDRGEQAVSGPYFYRFITPKYSATKKMILLK